jgi:hypothetical protein
VRGCMAVPRRRSLHEWAVTKGASGNPVERIERGLSRKETTEMRKLGALILLAALTVALLPAGTALAQKPTRATTTHDLAVAPVVEGDYKLAWQGTITGDINGCIQWWTDITTWTVITKPTSPAQASHYTEKTVVFEGPCGTSRIILETLERGTTTMANMSWRSNGVVVAADNPDWVGRSVHQRGTFEMTFDEESGLPNWGEGKSTFRLN